jgi:O-antigen/teichoic acid export membrane protein
MGKFLTNSITYLAGSISTTIISVLSLVVLTHFLSVSEYGELSLLLTICTLSAYVFGLEFSGSVIIEYNIMGKESNRYATLMGSLIAFSFLFSSVVIFLILFGTFFLDLDYYSGIDRNLTVIAIISGYFLSIAFFGDGFFIVSENAKSLVILRIFRSLIFLIGLVSLFVFFDYGVTGAIIANLISTTSVAIILMYILLMRFGISFDFDLIKSSLLFCLPLMIHGLGIWALVASDRFVLEYYLDYEDVGIYSFGYAICAFLAMVIASIDNSWAPIFLEICEKKEGFSKIVGEVWDSLPAVFSVISLAFLTISPILIDLLGGSDYSQSNSVVPWLVMGMYFQGLYMSYSKTLPLKKKTPLLAIITISCAILNLLLTVILVPELGLIGAAVATCLAYLFLMSASLFFSQKIESMQIDYFRILSNTAKLSAAMAVTHLAFQESLLYGLTSGFTFCAVLALIARLDFLTFISVGDRRIGGDSTTT